MQRPHCGPYVLIRYAKWLRQAQPIPAQPPEVEDLAPVSCEVTIDLSAVGNVAARPRTFLLLGLFYPRRHVVENFQESLFDL
ncbi:hypothetical protein [Streptomyces rishiriensis]|uniref:hypothetical protein n=1 Tax=Streptomyces rishiriensis TaxID=68264 RepID=UPI00340A7BBF